MLPHLSDSEQLYNYDLSMSNMSNERIAHMAIWIWIFVAGVFPLGIRIRKAEKDDIMIFIVTAMMIISVLNIQRPWRTIMACVMNHVPHTQSLALGGGGDNQKY